MEGVLDGIPSNDEGGVIVTEDIGEAVMSGRLFTPEAEGDALLRGNAELMVDGVVLPVIGAELDIRGVDGTLATGTETGLAVFTAEGARNWL